MRNPIDVLKSLETKACDTGYVFERLYRNLYNPEFFLLAYKNTSASQGSMTAGADGMTLDDMSMARIEKIIATLKDHSYQPKPVRRTYIEKKNSSKKRPLGIPSTNDKLIQEVVRMILEAIYEPVFSSKSHGFRPIRSCHTALLEIQGNFTGVKWFVEGDIKACFDNFDHHVLINILRRRIKDEYFISLIWKFLKAGYMEQWTYCATYSGVPQGSGISPILSNVYLSELDKYMDEYKERFDKTDEGSRKFNKAYRAIDHKYKVVLKRYNEQRATISEEKRREMLSELLCLRRERQAIPCYPVLDTSYKRLQYNRYADDFLIGVIGSKADAEKIKADIGQFLQEKLKLTMSDEKTKVTHSNDMIRYLGYDVTVSRDKSVMRDKNGTQKRMWYGKVKLYLPREKWVNKLREYNAFKVYLDENGRECWKPCHRGYLTNRKELDIISRYNAEIRGIYNYYRLAQNVSTLNNFKDIMQRSMFKTFAAKYKSTVTKIKESRMKDGVFGVEYETKSGIKRCEFYHAGFKKTRQADFAEVDILPNHRKYATANSFALRLRAGVCELCGAKVEDIRIHHVRALKELSGRTTGELLMLKRRRKSLALCCMCHDKEHAILSK